LRGREAVRAQSTILQKKSSQTAFAFIHNRVFGTDALHIRAKNTVGARSAQWPRADIGTRRTILRTVAFELARTATRPRGSSMAHG
jgi:hypothetical protein